MIATDMTSCGDPEEKLRWAFRMYDKDGSGEIDMEEMVDIFSLMYTVQVRIITLTNQNTVFTLSYLPHMNIFIPGLH